MGYEAEKATIEEYHQLHAQLYAIGEYLSKLGKAILEIPEVVPFADAGSVPVEMASHHGQFQAVDWPSPREIKRLVVARYKAEPKAQTAYNALPPEEREGLYYPGKRTPEPKRRR
jgi:hypothetical protein